MITNSLIKKILSEATTEFRSRGSYIAPLLPGYREFEKNQMAPFTEFATQWDDAMLDHDSLDGKMSTNKKTINKREKKAEKISQFIKNNPDVFAWADDAGIMNALPGKNLDAKPIKNFDPKKTVTKLGEWYIINDDILTEDLAVWFGKKKKPKGSSQPKGPWVDICRKVNGKHPPCGRSDADKGSYPKCRAAGVAGKMTDSEKKSACQQKRKAEKKDPQRGKGQKPVMVSHKKKTNENMEKNIITLTENDLYRIVKRVLKEQTETLPTGTLNLFCRNYTNKYGRGLIDMVGVGSTKETQFGTSFNVKKSERSDIPKDTAFGDEDFISDQVTTLEIGVPTDTFKKYLMVRFPEIDFNKTELNNILYIKNFSGGQGACRVEEKTSQDWIDWLKSKDVAFDLDI